MLSFISFSLSRILLPIFSFIFILHYFSVLTTCDDVMHYREVSLQRTLSVATVFIYWKDVLLKK